MRIGELADRLTLQPRATPTISLAARTENPMTTDTRTYSVPGISCDHCKRAIEAEVAPLPDVEVVEVDVDAKTVTVNGGDSTAIEAAIADAGYAIA